MVEIVKYLGEKEIKTGREIGWEKLDKHRIEREGERERGRSREKR